MQRFHGARRHLDRSYLDVVQRLAPELAQRMASAERADARTHVGSTRSFLRKAFGPGWALLGDAHQKKDPCTAQGITDAFCAAERLASAIDRSFRGESDLAHALAEYEAEHVAWAMPFFELTCDLARFAAPTPEQVALHSALRNSPGDVDAFVGLITQATSPADCFAPANIERILARSAS